MAGSSRTPTERADELREIKALSRRVDIEGLRERLSEAYSAKARAAALNELIVLGTANAWKAITDVLSQEPLTVGQPALQTLSDVNSPEVIPAIAGALGSKNIFLRSEAVRLLSGRDDRTVWSYLLRASRDPAESIRRLATRQLLELTSTRRDKLGELRKELLEGIFSVLPVENVETLLVEDLPAVVRDAAILRMSETSNPETVAFLMRLCIEPGAEHGDAAIEAIENNPTILAKHIKIILDRTDSPYYERLFACFAKRAGNEDVEMLIQALSSRRPSIRKNAALALNRMFADHVLPMLTGLATDPASEVVLALMDCLEHSSVGVAEPLLVSAALEGPPEVRGRALSLAAELTIPHPALEDLYCGILKDGLTDARPVGDLLNDMCNAVKTLGRMTSKKAMPLLAQASLSVSARLRRMAVEAIESYPQDLKIRMYENLIDAPDPRLVARVAFALYEKDPSSALVPLIRTAMGPRKRDGRKADEVLSGMAETRDLRVLSELLHSPHPRVKQYAVESLADFADPRLVSKLVSAIERGDTEAQERAMRNLQEVVAARREGREPELDDEDLDGEEGEETASPEALELLLSASDESDELLQLSAVESLERYVHEPKVAERLIAFLDYGSVPVRQKSVEILGRNKIVYAVPALIKALNNIFLRSYAEEALRIIGDRRGYLAVVRKRKREKMFPKRSKIERDKLKKQRARKKRPL